MPKDSATSRPRRSRGEGAVYKTAEGRWRATLIVTNPHTGLPVRKVVSGKTDRIGLLFTDAVGRAIPPGHVSKAWRATADTLGFAVPFRALRHTAATTWLRSGVPLIVSQALGHTGIAITAAHYAAVAPELHSATADAMDRALGGAS